MKERIFKIDWKRAIINNVERQIQDYKQTDDFLENDFLQYNKNLSFENQITVKKLFNKIYNQPHYKTSQKLFDFEVLLANLINAEKKTKCVNISKNSNHWKMKSNNKKNRYDNVSRFTLEALEQLKKHKMINEKRGYKDLKNPKNSRNTKIWATEKLIEYCKTLPTGIKEVYKELVVLRDNQKNLLDYKDTAETHKIRKRLTILNKVNSEAEIKYKNTILQPCIRAIFLNKFTLYGRLHTGGYKHNYQSYASEDRIMLTINGNTVTELDYAALHPNLLYADVGIQYMGDPYSKVNDNPQARTFLKKILLALINSSNEMQAERAANNWLFENKEECKILHKIGITKARPFIDKFIEEHKPISHFFFTGAGLRVMNRDAKICLDVCYYFAQKNIPILPVHDSFIIQEQYKNELKKVMQDVYKRHTNFRIKVK